MIQVLQQNFFSFHPHLLHSAGDRLFFPTVVITQDFLPITHLPSAPVSHITNLIKNRSKMHVGFVNIARLP